MRKITTIFLLILLSCSLMGQNKKEIKAYENAVILINNGKYKEAIPILRELIRENKNFVDASWTLSDLYKKMCNDEKRISTLLYIAKPSVPRYNNTLNRLATAYHETCNYEMAIETYKKIPQSEST